METQPKQYKYLSVVTVLFVAVLMISNITATKIIQLAGFALDGGTILFPLSYVFGDVLTEVYGYKRSRIVIWLGFLACILMSVTFAIVGALPAADFWTNQDAYDAILGQTPRIVIASLIAYFAGEFSNSYILAKMKVKMAGSKLWARTIGSTVVGEFVDTVLFIAIAFTGLMPGGELFAMMLANYVFKTGIEVAFTPVTYRIVGFLKRAEHEDYYDRETNFNPFAV